MPVALPKESKHKAAASAIAKPILLVEDNENDLLFMSLSMEQAGIENPVQVLKDGRTVLEYMEGKGKYADREQFPLPYLLLLDLKLPYVMGLEVLRWIRERPQFDSTIVVVLTSSADPHDVDECYRLHANAYLVKPSGMDKLRKLAECLREFWLEQNQPGTSFQK